MFPFPGFWRKRAETAVSQGAGTAIGNMTAAGGLAAAFDGNTNQSSAASANGSNAGNSFSGYNNTVGKDWGAGVQKTIDRFKFWGPNNNNVLGGQGTIDFKLQGSDDNSTWADLYATTGVSSPLGSTVIDITSGVTLSPYRYHRLNLNGNGSNGMILAELQFWEMI